jgi:hypothetical protein
MEANNISRKIAKEVAVKMGWVQEGNSNFFRNTQGKLINITVSTSGTVESRQFRKDCDYLVSYDTKTKKVSIYRNQDLKLSSVTRIGADGVVYYQARPKF